MVYLSSTVSTATAAASSDRIIIVSNDLYEEDIYGPLTWFVEYPIDAVEFSIIATLRLPFICELVARKRIDTGYYTIDIIYRKGGGSFSIRPAEGVTTAECLGYIRNRVLTGLINHANAESSALRIAGYLFQ